MLYEISIDNLGHRILNVAGQLARKRNMSFRQIKKHGERSILELDTDSENHLNDFIETLETDSSLKIVSILAEDGTYLTRQTSTAVWVKRSRQDGPQFELTPIL